MTEQQNVSQFRRYLNNNKELVQQKHKQYFHSIDKPTLHAIPSQLLIDFIYDIFCIGKYKQDQRTNQKITSSLLKNIKQYNDSHPTNKEQLFGTEQAVELLMFCIQHNEIFHVQYDPKDKNEGVSRSQQEEPDLNVEVRKSQLANNSKADSQSKVFEDENKNKEKDEAELIRTRIRGRSNAHQQLQNQFDSSPERIKFSITSDLIKKNAKLAFLNYCKNQMQVGGRKTFDQLQHQASTMTIGKLLVYAKTYGMLNELITKKLLMHKFTRISQGKRSIDFEKYYQMLTELVAVDGGLIQRLELNDENLYKKVKFANYPFHTQDQNPRELVANRNFTHKITSHSGKTQLELRQDLAARKLSHAPLGNLKSLHKHILRQSSSQKLKGKQKLLSPKDLSSGLRSRDYSIDLSFIDKIVSPEDNDHQYLGQYQLGPHRRGEDSAMSSMILRRKASIVDNIRKRMKQLQNQDNSKGSPQLARRRYQL